MCTFNHSAIKVIKVLRQEYSFQTHAAGFIHLLPYLLEKDEKV